MPKIYNKETGESIPCDKEQISAMLAGNYSLKKPELTNTDQEVVKEKAIKEEAANVQKLKEDASKKQSAAKTAEAKKDNAKLPGNAIR